VTIYKAHSHWVSRISGSGRGTQHLVLSIMVRDALCLTLTACNKSELRWYLDGCLLPVPAECSLDSCRECGGEKTR